MWGGGVGGGMGQARHSIFQLVGWAVAGRGGVDLAGDVSFQHSDDFGFGASLRQSSLQVAAGTVVAAEASDHDAP